MIVTTPDRRQVLEGGGWVPGDRTTFVDGGDRRQDLVRAGFRALEETVPDPDGSRVVLVHDGARPFVPAMLVAEVVAATERHGAAIPVVPVSDTLKRVVDDRIEAHRRPLSIGRRTDPAGRPPLDPSQRAGQRCRRRRDVDR